MPAERGCWPVLTIAEAADENFVVHASWVPRRTAGMLVREDPDLVVVDSGLPCDTFNCVCRTRLAPADVSRRVAEVADTFRQSRRPFSWWVGPADRPPDLAGALVAAGLERAETELAMSADLAALPGVDADPPGLEIRKVRTAQELADFATVSAANWDPPDRQVSRFYEVAAPALLAPDAPQWLYVGYVNGAAVSTSELTVGGGVIGLYNVSTLAAYRGRGFGSALTARPLPDARSLGHTTAILQAAPDGVGIYARLGFRSYGEITEYKPAADIGG